MIEVGKNSLQNDRLTLHARGGETWLHAQGIPGSHVLIRTESEPSDETLLYAAKLAAYFSKGRNHPQLPVDYTRRKYVKKSANAPAGLVTYTNFKTLIIGLTPEEWHISFRKEAADDEHPSSPSPRPRTHSLFMIPTAITCLPPQPPLTRSTPAWRRARRKSAASWNSTPG